MEPQTGSLMARLWCCLFVVIWT